MADIEIDIFQNSFGDLVVYANNSWVGFITPLDNGSFVAEPSKYSKKGKKEKLTKTEAIDWLIDNGEKQ